MYKETSLNRTKGSMQWIPSGAWHLGSNADNNINKSLINNNNTKVSEYLIQNTNECNNCRVNPPTNNPFCGIVDTGETKNYIKVYTPCANKVKKMQGLQAILPDESLMQATHMVEINLSPLLSTISKTAHIFPRLQ